VTAHPSPALHVPFGAEHDSGGTPVWTRHRAAEAMDPTGRRGKPRCRKIACVPVQDRDPAADLPSPIPVRPSSAPPELLRPAKAFQRQCRSGQVNSSSLMVFCTVVIRCPKRSRRRTRWLMTDTAGAQPSPETMTTSCPSARCRGRPSPNGTRTPSRSPGRSSR